MDEDIMKAIDQVVAQTEQNGRQRLKSIFKMSPR
jgi:hypothetical protein